MRLGHSLAIKAFVPRPERQVLSARELIFAALSDSGQIQQITEDILGTCLWQAVAGNRGLAIVAVAGKEMLINNIMLDLCACRCTCTVQPLGIIGICSFKALLTYTVEGGMEIYMQVSSGWFTQRRHQQPRVSMLLRQGYSTYRGHEAHHSPSEETDLLFLWIV